MTYSDKISKAKVIIEAYNKTVIRTDQINFGKFESALKRLGGTSTEALAQFTTDILICKGLPFLLSRQIAVIFSHDNNCSIECERPYHPAEADPAILENIASVGMVGRIRNKVASKVASIKRQYCRHIEQRNHHSNYYVPITYAPGSITNQLNKLLRYFPHLDGDWIRSEGEKWYNNLGPLPPFIEGPFVAVDPIALDETLNKAFWQILDATYYDGTIVMLDKTSTKTLRLKDKTARFYRELRRQQPGSFLLFPGQFGFHYRGRELSDVEISMYNQEFLVCPAVGACMILNHPSRFKMYSPSLLNIKFGGAHCHDHNCVLISRNHITYRGSRRIELRHSHDNKLDAYGVVTGFLP